MKHLIKHSLFLAATILSCNLAAMDDGNADSGTKINRQTPPPAPSGYVPSDSNNSALIPHSTSDYQSSAHDVLYSHAIVSNPLPAHFVPDKLLWGSGDQEKFLFFNGKLWYLHNGHVKDYNQPLISIIPEYIASQSMQGIVLSNKQAREICPAVKDPRFYGTGITVPAAQDGAPDQPASPSPRAATAKPCAVTSVPLPRPTAAKPASTRAISVPPALVRKAFWQKPSFIIPTVVLAAITGTALVFYYKKTQQKQSGQLPNRK